jgi:hypothetical protein
VDSSKQNLYQNAFYGLYFELFANEYQLATKISCHSQEIHCKILDQFCQRFLVTVYMLNFYLFISRKKPVKMPLTRLASRYHRDQRDPANHIEIISQLEEEFSDVVLTQSGKFPLFLTFFFYNESLLLCYEIAFILFHMYIFLFHLEKDDDQKPTLKKETKSTAHESNPAEKVDSEDFEMESFEVIGDEIESGKFPYKEG